MKEASRHTSQRMTVSFHFRVVLGQEELVCDDRGTGDFLGLKVANLKDHEGNFWSNKKISLFINGTYWWVHLWTRGTVSRRQGVYLTV